MAMPALVINPPELEVQPVGRLLDIARPIEELLRSTINGDRDVASRWILGGVTWTPNTFFALDTTDVDACSTFNFAAPPQNCDAVVTQTPFSVYKIMNASPLEYSPEDIELLLKGWVSNRLSAAFATELMRGAISGDKSLRAAAQPVKSPAYASTALPVAEALRALEDQFARTVRGARGLIHMPPGMLGLADTGYGAELVDGQYQTPLGNVIVADAGYVDSINPTALATPAGNNTDWIYMSGYVYYGVEGPDMVDDGNIGSSITNYGAQLSGQVPPFGSRNRMSRIATAQGILVFDPGSVFAQLATTETQDVA